MSITRQPETAALDPLEMDSPLELWSSKMQPVTEREQLEAAIPTSLPEKVQSETARAQSRTCRASRLPLNTEPVIITFGVRTRMPLVLPSALATVPAPLTRLSRISRMELGAARK